MEKKLIAQGPNKRKSYTVTLPLEWVKQQGLDKTKVVDLELVGSKAIIHSSKEERHSVFIDADKGENAMMKTLQSAYRLGIDELKVKYSKPGLRKYISEIIDTKLIGYEIIEHKKGFLIIKDITKESTEEFKTVLRRIFLLLVEISQSPEESEDIDKNLKKLVNYCQRLLIKKGHLEYKKVPFYYSLLDQIEKISDEYVWLYESTIKDKKTMAKINSYLLGVYKMFYKFDFAKFNKYQHDSFLLREKLKNKHMHNIARQINTVLGTVLSINFDKI